MGIFSRSGKTKIEAQYAPQIMGDNYNSLTNYVLPMIARKEAMSIPSVARCRNLIAGTIASMPLEYYKISTGEEIAAPRWVAQPSEVQPANVTIAWTVDSLIFYGVSYWEVTSVYQEDNRPASFEWVSNLRVTFDTDLYNTTVKTYYVDGVARPMSGLGSLVTFQAFNEGVLNYGAQLLKTAIDVNRAAAVAAETPMATGILKNTGADLPPAEVQGLLNAFKNARKNRSTAYLTSTLEYNTVGFSPREMGYQDQIQNLATEVARLLNVPAYYISADQNTSMTYANVIDERKQFFALTLAPYVDAIEKRLSMNDISTSGHQVKFDVDKSFLKVDPMQRLLVTEKLLTLGLITTEQAMEMEDLSPNGSNGVPDNA